MQGPRTCFLQTPTTRGCYLEHAHNPKVANARAEVCFHIPKRLDMIAARLQVAGSACNVKVVGRHHDTVLPSTRSPRATLTIM